MDRRLDVVTASCGEGEVALGVREHERAVELELVEQRQGLGVVGLGLAGEARQHVGRQREVGHRRPQPADQVAEPAMV
ncbi:MAG: hypothetical protein R2939_08865 [Kofleriaceae bacterium]